MHPFDALVIAYLAFFVVAALFARVSARRRVATAVGAAAIAVAIYVVVQVFPIHVRWWLPFLFIAIGYWIPVPLVPAARGGAFEGWLRHTDGRAAEDEPRSPMAGCRTRGRLSRVLSSCADLVAVVWTAGSPADVARVWPTAGVVLGVVAVAAAVGAAVGRYHYVADVVVGAAAGVAACFCASL